MFLVENCQLKKLKNAWSHLKNKRVLNQHIGMHLVAHYIQYVSYINDRIIINISQIIILRTYARHNNLHFIMIFSVGIDFSVRQTFPRVRRLYILINKFDSNIH